MRLGTQRLPVFSETTDDAVDHIEGGLVVDRVRRPRQASGPCSVAATLELVGDRWTWLIVRDAFLGMTRFAEFRESLGLAPNVLTDRLRRLVDEDVFERVRYDEHPERFDYVLTAKGADLFVALDALRQWGDRYLRPLPMRLLVQKSDGRPVIVALVPEESQVLSNDEVMLIPRPGFPRR